MNVNLVCALIVLENETNSDIRKNDLKKFKILMDSKNNLLKINENESWWHWLPNMNENRNVSIPYENRFSSWNAVFLQR